MNKELLSGLAAAELLHQMLPDRTVEQWALWLRNNRNQTRKALYRIPAERISNSAFYQAEELTKFVEWEKFRRLGKVTVTGRAAEVMRAFGIGEASGGVHGRKFDYTVNVQCTEGKSIPYVQLILSDPLLVFRLESNELANLIDALTAAKQRIVEIEEVK